MSKSISENPVFSEIWVRVGWEANLINCNVGFACISLPTGKVKAEQFRSKTPSSKLLLPSLFLFYSSWNFSLESTVKHVCIEIKETKLRTFLYPSVIWDLADTVKPAGDRSQYRLYFNKHK